MDIRNHFNRDKIKNELEKVIYIATNENAADYLTKLLTKEKVLLYNQTISVVG